MCCLAGYPYELAQVVAQHRTRFGGLPSFDSIMILFRAYDAYPTGTIVSCPLLLKLHWWPGTDSHVQLGQSRLALSQ
jgi:hypothetical protein